MIGTILWGPVLQPFQDNLHISSQGLRSLERLCQASAWLSPETTPEQQRELSIHVQVFWARKAACTHTTSADVHVYAHTPVHTYMCIYIYIYLYVRSVEP